MSGQHEERETEAEAPSTNPDDPTVVAEPVVIDLRDGVDTIAAHEAEVARRAARAEASRRS